MKFNFLIFLQSGHFQIVFCCPFYNPSVYHIQTLCKMPEILCPHRAHLETQIHPPDLQLKTSRRFPVLLIKTEAVPPLLVQV